MIKELSPREVVVIKELHKSLLLHHNKIFVIKEFTIVEESYIKKRWFKSDFICQRTVLKSMELLVYMNENSTWYDMTDDGVRNFLFFYDLRQLRQNWVHLRTSLEKLGFIISVNNQEE